MPLVQLIYYSSTTSTHSSQNNDLKTIHQVANTTNTKLGVSGILLFNTSYYLQALEGPREKVNDLYFKILKDPRHKDCRLMSFTDISTRDFGDWGMAWANEALIKTELYTSYCGSSQLIPEKLNASNARNLLCEFAELARAQKNKI